MADRLTNIEFLLMLSEDVRSQGDDLSAEMHERGVAHARRVMDLLAMLDKARQLLEREKQRFGQYLPREQEPIHRDAIARESLPRVVSKGPAPTPRAATGE